MKCVSPSGTLRVQILLAFPSWPLSFLSRKLLIFVFLYDPQDPEKLWIYHRKVTWLCLPSLPRYQLKKKMLRKTRQPLFHPTHNCWYIIASVTWSSALVTDIPVLHLQSRQNETEKIVSNRRERVDYWRRVVAALWAIGLGALFLLFPLSRLPLFFWADPRKTISRYKSDCACSGGFLARSIGHTVRASLKTLFIGHSLCAGQHTRAVQNNNNDSTSDHNSSNNSNTE